MNPCKDIEKMRGKILKNAQETIREHEKGLTKRGTVEDLIKDLENNQQNRLK